MLQRKISDPRLQLDVLDGLRGLAVLVVIASHTSNAGMLFLPFLDLSGVGKAGVFLFFLLSSFLLSLPLLGKGFNVFSGENISNYWQRRFFRIYPLYFLYLLAGVVTTWLFSNFDKLNGHGAPFELSPYGMLEHLLLMDGKGVTWSIAVEFKFYFFLPFLTAGVAFLRRFGLSAALAGVVISVAIAEWKYPAASSTVNDSSLGPYLPIFLIGVGLAVIHLELQKINVSRGYRLALSGAGYLACFVLVLLVPSVYSVMFTPIDFNYFHKSFILYALLWSIVLLAAIHARGLISRLFKFKALRWFGAVSFSAYLFHIVFVKAMYVLEVPIVLSAYLVLFLTVVSSYLSLRFIEVPTSRLKVQWKSKEGGILNVAE